MRKLGKTLFIISSAFSFLITACGGSAIGDAQEFSPNEPPSIVSIKAVNFDGTEITQLDIEPYKQFKLIVEATDPDNNPLEYKFDSESGTFAGISSNPKGCTAVFKTGSIKGGQNIELWAGVSDGNGAIVRQSYNLGTGKLGPAITASFEKIRFRPVDKIKLSVSANCSGFFQLYCNGNGEEKFDFEKDMYRYSYGPNKTTDFILAGPNCTSHADIVLEAKPGYSIDADYVSEEYNLVLVFRDGLFQENSFPQDITIDGTPPKIAADNGFTPNSTGASTDPEVIVNFTEDIGYADSSSLTLKPAHGKIKLKSMSKNTAIFSVSGLNTSTPYEATVSGIKDIAGNVMVPEKYSFTTRSDPNAKFAVTYNGKTSYTAYAGFNDSTIQLTKLDGNPATDVTYMSHDLSRVTVESSTGKLKVETIDYIPANDNPITVTVDATSTSGDTAQFVVTIEPWYPVKTADDFGADGNIRKNLSGRFRLAIDEIDFGGATITPIGAYNNSGAFKGIFDGAGKTLKNFKMQAMNDYEGLFAYNLGTIQNLIIDGADCKGNKNRIGVIAGVNSKIITYCKVKNSYLSKIYFENVSYMGFIAGTNNETISNCDISDSKIDANSNAGMICGENWFSATISNCHTYMTDINSEHYVKGKEFCGGIAGSNHGEITGCTSSGSVESIYGNAGGITGRMAGGKIAGCDSTCNVKNTSSDGCVGGIIGSVYITSNGDHSIANCNYKGKSIIGQNYVGGLIGSIGFYEDFGNNVSLTIDGCSTEGNVYVEGTSNVGGLVGYVYGNSSGIEGKGSVIIANSHVRLNVVDSTADVTGVTNVGGLIGQVKGEVVNAVNITLCSAIVNISCNGNLPSGKYAGGLIGSATCGNNTPNCVMISQSFSKGTLSAQQGYAGGLIGSIHGTNVSDCYSSSVVSGPHYLGGLVGNAGICTINKCYALGTVPNINATTGGLVGEHGNKNNATVTACFRLQGNGSTANDSGTYSYLYGIPCETLDLQIKGTYSGWTFPSPWNIDPGKVINNGFPYLVGLDGQ